MSPNHDSIKRAINYLYFFLKSGKVSNGDRFPSIKQLALNAKVAKQTMAAALRQLANEGIITIIPKIGTFVGQPPPRTKPQNSMYRWQAVRDKLEHDIFEGNIGNDKQLPSLKELKLRYNVCGKTLRKALTALETTRIVVRRGRAFFPANTNKIVSKATIMVIVARNKFGGFYLSARNQELVRALGRNCAQKGIAIDLAIYAREPSGNRFIDNNKNIIDDINSRGIIIGYIIIAEHIEGLDRLVEYLSQFEKPIAILDELGTVRLARHFHTTVRRAVFALGYTSTCGIDAARFLIKLGHRRVAYISPYHSNLYSINRYKGIVEAFREAGVAAIATQCTFSEYTSSWELLSRKFHPSKALSPIGNKLNAVKKTVDRFLKNQKLRFSKYYANIYHRLIEKLESQLWLDIDSHYLVPLFEKALGIPHITAWIAVDDQVALMAIEFLKQNGIRVPADISVIGFDDSFDAIENNLTSYNFNLQGLASRMLYFILSPDNTSTSELGIIETGGMVISRNTTTSVPIRS